MRLLRQKAGVSPKKTMQSRKGRWARKGLAYSYRRKRRAGFSPGAHAITLMQLSVGTSLRPTSASTILFQISEISALRWL
jgi:hypothetical protein